MQLQSPQKFTVDPCIMNKLVHAAIASAEQSNNIGVCLVSTGCAATNTITGVLCAWQDGIPLVVISGQNFSEETRRYTGMGVRTYGQQEADIIELVKPITKFAEMIEKPSEIIPILEKAIFLAKSGRKGPVFLDIPLDLQSALIDEPEGKLIIHYLMKRNHLFHHLNILKK